MNVVALLMPLLSLLAAVMALEARGAEPSLISELISEKWGKVRSAKLELESQEAEGVASVIMLLDRDDVVPLTNTADLIYPGAKKFYGHGPIVDYDLDRIAVRAGWVLEETAFENFGFSEGAIREADLLNATRNGKKDVPLKDVLPSRRDAKLRTQQFAQARIRAKAWWSEKEKNWTRYAALKDALTSSDTMRQLNALSWLRDGKTQCKGLTPETYRRDILPLAKKLTLSSDEEIRDQASLLIKGLGQHWREANSEKSAP